MKHPQLALYSGNDPNGYPYAPDRKINHGLCIEAARYDLLTLDIDGTYDFLHLIQSSGGRTKILGLVRGAASWSGMIADRYKNSSRRGFWGELQDALDPDEGFVRTASGRYGVDGHGNSNINLADRDAREAFVRIVLKYITPFDGLFLDHWALSPRWMESPGDPVVSPDGSPFDWDAYDEGRMRVDARFAEAPIPVYGNGGSKKAAGFDGWMIENFPWQSGGFECTAPRGGGLYSALMPSPYPSPPDYQKMRFALGTACLFDSYACFVNSGWDRLRGHSPFLCDEMLVDGCGRSSGWYPGIGHRHWLGEAVSLPRQVRRLYIREFENGIVIVNPSSEPDSASVPYNLRAVFGELDPDVNHGRRVGRYLTVPAHDARFLWRG